jgi:hypothetical protein
LGSATRCWAAELTADQAFIKQYRTLLELDGQGKAVQFAKVKIDAVRAGVVQKTYKAFNRLGGGPKPNPNPNPNPAAEQPAATDFARH